LAGVPRIGIVPALSVTSAFYIAASGLIFAFPDTSKIALE
jgi:hypothetical protein